MIEAKFEDWKHSKEVVGVLFKQRKRNDAKPLMEKSLMEYLQLKNDIKNELQEEIVNSMNEKERINFIQTNIDHYHSYIQINELYNELEKAYYKRKAMKKER